MTYGWTKWTALAVVLASGLTVTSDAEARHRRHRRDRCCNAGYYNYGNQCCNTGVAWNQGGFQTSGACCQAAFIQPAATCCGVMQSSAHTTGYAPQGTYYGTNGTYGQSVAPPPPAEGERRANGQDNAAPRTEEAPPREATPPETPQPESAPQPENENPETDSNTESNN